MRHRLATALTILSMPFAAEIAVAQDPVPEGTKATVNFSLTVKEQTKSQWSNTAIERVLNAQCVMVAGPALQVSWDGPTAEQNAATAQAQANAAAFEQNYAPSADMMANMEAMMEKCGEDEACIQAEVMKMSQTSEVQQMVAKQDQAKADVAGLTPDLGPLRYQTWNAQGCEGTLSVNDTYFTSDPGGEGGYGAYQDTTTVNSSAPIDPQHLYLTIETDAVGNTTRYRVTGAVEANFPSVSTKDGPGERLVQLLGSTALPTVIGPLPGFLGSQSTTIPGEEGAITFQVQGK